MENQAILYTSTSNDSTEEVLFNMTAIVTFHWIVWGILSHTIVIFGIFSNIINIVCFVKQGFKDSINVSLTALAICDLGCLLPSMWTNLCYTPAFTDLDLPFEPSEIQYMTTGATHLALTRVSSWITAAITLERCLCVAMPLKVKEIVTPKRTFVFMVCISIVLLAAVSPQYYFYRAGKKFYAERNRTLYGIIFSKDVLDFEAISFPINFVIIPYLAYLIIIICTAILVIELNTTAKWREKSANSANITKLTSSKKNVAKMVVMISSLFIGSYAINVAIAIVVTVVPDFSVTGKLRHLIPVVGGIGYLFEIINASMNIFIYYHMSMKYRNVFNDIMCIRRLSD